MIGRETHISKKCTSGVPAVVQWVKDLVLSLQLLRLLLRCGSIPGPGTSICRRCSLKEKKKREEKKIYVGIFMCKHVRCALVYHKVSQWHENVTACKPGATRKPFLPPVCPLSRMFLHHLWWSPNGWFINQIVKLCKQCVF